jgi:hypothetical protein
MIVAASWAAACGGNDTGQSTPAVSGGGVSGSTVSGSAGTSTGSGVAGTLAAVAGTSSAATAGTGTQPSTGGHAAAGAAGTSSGVTAGASGAAGTSAGAAGATAGSGAAAAGKGGSGGATSGAGGASGRGGRGGTGGSGQAGSGASGATFTAVYKIFMTNCSGTGCHVSATGAGGLAMPDQMKAYMNLVGVNSMSCTGEKRVVAGDAAKSELVHTLDRTAIGSCGARTPKMPDNKPKLAQADIDTITAWVNAGAMND